MIRRKVSWLTFPNSVVNWISGELTEGFFFTSLTIALTSLAEHLDLLSLPTFLRQFPRTIDRFRIPRIVDSRLPSALRCVCSMIPGQPQWVLIPIGPNQAIFSSSSEVPLALVLEDFIIRIWFWVSESNFQYCLLSWHDRQINFAWCFASNTTFANYDLQCRVCVSDFFEICRLLIQN